MPATLPHAQWEGIHTDAEDFADHIKSVVESTLTRLSPEERSIYCEHLHQLGNYWGFEVEASQHDEQINRQHGRDCPCVDCISIYGLPF